MKIYIIMRSNHFYEEWDVCQVYATLENAEEAAKILEEKIERPSWTHYNIYEREVEE